MRVAADQPWRPEPGRIAADATGVDDPVPGGVVWVIVGHGAV